MNTLPTRNLKEGDRVFVNGEIVTNCHLRGDVGVNDIRQYTLRYEEGTIVKILISSNLTLYFVKFDREYYNYGIEILEDKLTKFRPNNIVKRIKGTNITGEIPEAVGMIGLIINIIPAGEFPLNNTEDVGSGDAGRFLPLMYAIIFPELYKGTDQNGTMLLVPEEDLEIFKIE